MDGRARAHCATSENNDAFDVPFAHEFFHMCHFDLRGAAAPAAAFPVCLALVAQADLLLESQAAVPARWQATGFVFSYPSMESALKNLA